MSKGRDRMGCMSIVWVWIVWDRLGRFVRDGMGWDKLGYDGKRWVKMEGKGREGLGSWVFISLPFLLQL